MSALTLDTCVYPREQGRSPRNFPRISPSPVVVFPHHDQTDVFFPFLFFEPLGSNGALEGSLPARADTAFPTIPVAFGQSFYGDFARLGISAHPPSFFLGQHQLFFQLLSSNNRPDFFTTSCFGDPCFGPPPPLFSSRKKIFFLLGREPSSSSTRPPCLYYDHSRLTFPPVTHPPTLGPLLPCWLSPPFPRAREAGLLSPPAQPWCRPSQFTSPRLGHQPVPPPPCLFPSRIRAVSPLHTS